VAATLVLNASYEPLCVVPFRRAVVLVLAEKAIIVEANGTLRSDQFALDLPSVIRLTRFVRVPYRTRLAFSKRAVLIRDNYTCAYCGAGKAGTVDHVVPKALGGLDEFSNTVAACGPCNNKKGHKTLAQMGWTLRFTPADPVGVGGVIRGGRSTPGWEPYLQWGRVPASI
jgi:5-methylcytosine-specific restriction endonuclease McrA